MVVTNCGFMIQVVNELLQPVGNIPRHVAHPHHRSAECEPTREADSSSSSEVSDIALGDYNQRSPPVHVASVTSPPRVTKEVLPSVGDVRGFNWAVVTPSIAKTKSTLSNRSGMFCIKRILIALYIDIKGIKNTL